MTRTVFVFGIDDFNLQQLQAIRNAETYRFEPLLTFDDVKAKGTYPFRQVLEAARERLREYPGTIDAVVGYWDFPVTTIVPILCREFGLPGPSVEAVARCEHKYWSRRIQAEVIPEMTPPFHPVDPFDPDPLAKIDLPYPFWLKPVKGTDSLLGFKIENAQDLDQALGKIRDKISAIATPFNDFLNHAQVPETVAPVDGGYCLAEGMIAGHQCTVCGYVHQGQVVIYGVVDSFNYPHRSSFFRYQYPSILSGPVKQRLAAASKKVMTHIGYDQAAFNIEYFYDESRDAITLLEINPRISQSHGLLFEQVDGFPDHQIMVQLGCGQAPDFPRGEGPFGCSAEFHVRRFEDGVVRRAPTREQIRAIEERHPGTTIDVAITDGMRLSDMIEQDSYSYDIVHVFIGARDDAQLMQKYEAILEALPIEIDRSG